MPSLPEAIAYFVVFLFSTTLHEAAHAWVALKGGDPTAAEGGQVTLDPIPHIRRSPFGMVVLPLLTAILTGWPLGFASAPFNPKWADEHPKRAAVMSLAGPAANTLLVLLSVAALRAGVAAGVFTAPNRIGFGHIVEAPAGGWWSAAGLVVGVFFSVNLVLAVFNLLPLPPLDGSGAVPLVLDRGLSRSYQHFLWSNPALAWLGIFVAWQAFDWIFNPIFFHAVNLLYPGVTYG